MFMVHIIILTFIIIYKELTEPYVNPYAKRRRPPPGQYERMYFKVADFIFDDFISSAIVLMFISVFVFLFVCSDFRHELLYK